MCSFSEAPHPLYGTVLGKFQTNFHWSCVGVGENTVQKVLKWRLAVSWSYDDIKLYYEYFSYSVSRHDSWWLRWMSIHILSSPAPLMTFKPSSPKEKGSHVMCGATSEISLAQCSPEWSSSQAKVLYVLPVGIQMDCAWCTRLERSSTAVSPCRKDISDMTLSL